MATIPLAIQTPQPASPLQNIGQLMQVRDAMSQIALRNAQVQSAQQQADKVQAEAEQRNRDLADQNTLQGVMKDPDSYSKLMTGDVSPLAGKVQPKTLQALTTWQTEHEKGLLANTAEQNTLRSEGLGRIVDTAAGLQSLVGPDGKPDLARINSALPGAIQHLQSTNAFKQAGVTEGIPTQVTDPDQLNQWLAQFGGLKAATDKALAQQKLKNDVITGAPNAEGLTPQQADAANRANVKMMEDAAAANRTARRLENAPEAPGTPEQQFITEYQTVHQGAPVADAIKAYRSAAATPEKPPESMMLVPQAGGGYRSQIIRPGQDVPEGAVTPSGLSSISVPTSATRTMAEAAPKVQGLADRVLALVDAQEKDLGPGSSRVREFLAGKIGAKDTEFSKLRTDLGLLQTMLMRMHVGARGGTQIMEHFKDLIDASKQDPDNLRAAIGEIKEYARTVTEHSGGGSGMVKLQAPDGSVKEFSAAEAEHYIKLGAKKVK